jgi:hypothetical protein
MKAVLLTVFFILAPLRGAGIENDSTRTPLAREVSYPKLIGFCTLYGGGLLYSQMRQAAEYWTDPVPFYLNFQNDWKYAHGADKFGHAMAGYVLNRGLKEGLLWSGVDTTTAVWSGFAFAMLHQTIVEVRDGYAEGKNGSFAPYLGFSWGDMSANFVGAAFPVVQHYVPSLSSLRYKYSLNPSAKMKSGAYYNTILADYEYHWLSVNVYDLLPKSAQSYWTPYLNLAIGHSVKDIVDSPGHYTFDGHHEWWISLDYNLELLPGDSDLLRLIKKFANLYKLPAPCVRILPSVVWYGIRL